MEYIKTNRICLRSGKHPNVIEFVYLLLISLLRMTPPPPASQKGFGRDNLQQIAFRVVDGDPLQDQCILYYPLSPPFTYDHQNIKAHLDSIFSQYTNLKLKVINLSVGIKENLLCNQRPCWPS